MYLDKVEMRFVMDDVNTSLVLIFGIVVMDPAPFRESHGLAHPHSLMSYLPPLLVTLGQCPLSYSKLQEDTFHPVKLVQIMCHISYGVSRWLWYWAIILKSTSAPTHPRGCLKGITRELCR